MRIVLATPLYPPEIAEPAPYVKELAKRLSQKHAVTVVAYGRLPEAVPGVRIITVDKHRPVLVRLIAYTIALFRASRGAAVTYALNGASVELPTALVTLVTRRPLLFHIGDAAAHDRATHHLILRTIEHFARSQARTVTHDSPQVRPEILPFAPYPTEQLTAYEQSWASHLANLETLLRHV